MAEEPVWIELAALLALHDRTIALHGGAEGVRDAGQVDAARTILKLAAGELGIEALTDWVRANCRVA